MRLAPLPFLLLLGLPLCAVAQQEAGDRARPVLVTGRVVERGSGAAIPGVRVVLEGAAMEAISDSRGRFQLLRAPSGTYLLRIEHVGYGPVADSLEVPTQGRVALDIRLVARPLQLEPVVVAVTNRGHPNMLGFYERMRTGLGRYLTRADFETGAVLQVTDALRRVPGVRLVPRTAGGVTIGQAVQLRGGCQPAVYLDGTRLSTRGTTLDEILHPNDVEGVEVYRGPETPARFAAGAGGCGAIVIWTQPGGDPGTIPLWKATLITGGLALLVLLLKG